ncbi:MAG TPA: hypothetical protein VI488_18920 [Candidatus Angelobacter sp.]
MTVGRFLVRTIVVAVTMFALGFLGHQLLLGRDYAAIEPIMRSKPEMQAHMQFAPISCLVFSAAFAWIYSQGRSARLWLGQGIRFGVAVWAIASVPQYLTNYVIEPWPGMFVAKIVAWEFIAAVLLGILVAALARNDGAQTRAAKV